MDKNLQKFRSFELYGAALEGSTNFLCRSSWVPLLRGGKSAFLRLGFSVGLTSSPLVVSYGSWSLCKLFVHGTNQFVKFYDIFGQNDFLQSFDSDSPNISLDLTF